jgi:hypothetical protein
MGKMLMRAGVAGLGLGALAAVASAATPLGSEFTYQGRLKLAGAALTGTADFQFSLWDAAGSGSPPTGGAQIGGISVSNRNSIVNFIVKRP